MAISRSPSDDEVARARLAFISAGQRPLSAPRRSVGELPGHAPPEPEVRGAEVGAEAGPVDESAVEARPRWLPRVLLTRRHVAVLLVLVLLGVGVAVAALGRSSASQVPLQVTTEPPPATPVAEASPSHSPPAPPLRVHVLGAVTRPGVVTVPDGSIVLDAVDAAGGLAPDADPDELNFAARLADGQQVVVGTTSSPRGEVVDEPGEPSGSQGTADAPLDLNSATQQELEELPGVGPVLAGAILGWREENGDFSSVAELQEVPGIGPKSFASLEPLVTV